MFDNFQFVATNNPVLGHLPSMQQLLACQENTPSATLRDRQPRERTSVAAHCRRARSMSLVVATCAAAISTASSVNGSSCELMIARSGAHSSKYLRAARVSSEKSFRLLGCDPSKERGFCALWPWDVDGAQLFMRRGLTLGMEFERSNTVSLPNGIEIGDDIECFKSLLMSVNPV